MTEDTIHASTAEAQVATLEAAVADKLADAETPGYWAEFTNEEAEMAGYFPENALSEEEAYDASFDNPDVLTQDNER